jgi:AcrR family transcriptional regulator
MADTTEGGVRASLSRDRVVQAAVELADVGGIESITMRKLGEAVGVEAMSLYNHVANKDDLLDGMVDWVFANIDLPSTDIPWKQAVRDRAVAVRQMLDRHRWAISLMDSRRSPGAATLGHLDAFLGCFRRAGFSIPMTAHAIAVLDAYTFGFALEEAALPFEGPDEAAELAQELVGGLEDYPHLHELTVEHVLQPGYDYGAEFEFGLDLILDALELVNSSSTDRNTE